MSHEQNTKNGILLHLNISVCLLLRLLEIHFDYMLLFDGWLSIDKRPVIDSLVERIGRTQQYQ